MSWRFIVANDTDAELKVALMLKNMFCLGEKRREFPSIELSFSPGKFSDIMLE